MKKFSFITLLKFSLYLFVLTLPLQNRDLFSFFGTRLFPPRLVLIGMIASASGYGLYIIIKSGRFFADLKYFCLSLWSDHLLRILLLLWVIRLLSIRESLNAKASFSLMLFYTSMVALYLILRFVRNKDFNFLQKVFNVYLLTISLVGLFGFLQAILSLFGLRLPGVLVGSTFIRIPSTFYDANHLPPFILSGLPLLLVLAFSEGRAWLKYLLYSLVAILSLVIFLTFSRSGVISFLVVYLLFFLYFVKKRYWKKFSFLVVVSLVLLFLIYISSRTTLSFVKRAASVFDLQDKSTVAHGILLYGGFAVWQRNPIFGVGYGGFSEAFRATQLGKEHAYFDPAVQVRLPIHSIWLETLAETGIIGFSVYLSLMIIVAEKLWLAFKLTRNPRIKLSLLAIFSSLVAILTSGIFYSYNLEFFWFFVFFAYLSGDILLKERRAEAEVELLEAPERLNWTELKPVFLLVAIVLPLLLYNLSFPLLSPGLEGFFAVVSKTIRRTGGMGWPLWWLPKFEDTYFFGKPPFFFWLTAFNIFLYDIITSAVRFWSAFFAFLAVLLLYLLVRVKYNRRRALLAALVLMATPLFPVISRRGVFEPVTIFSATALFLTYFLSRRNARFFPFLGIALSITFLLDQVAGFVLGTALVLAALADIFIAKNIRIYRSFWLLLVFVFPLITSLPWVLYAYPQFPAEFVKGYFGFGFKEAVYILGLSLWPLLAILLSRVFYKMRFVLAVWLLSLVAVAQIVLTPQADHQVFIRLIEKRLEVNRQGTIPLIMVADKSEDLLYYSEVPIIFTKEEDLNTYFAQDRAYFFITEGESFRQRAADLLKNNIGGVRVIAADRGLVLVEKLGPIP